MTRHSPPPPRFRLAIASLAAALLGGCGAETQDDVADTKHVDANAPEAGPKPASDGAQQPQPADTALGGDILPNECRENLPAKLAECDPMNMATWGIDCDGDGMSGYTAELCNASQVAHADGLSDVDCDDTDANLELWAADDADGDGEGSATPLTCVGEDIPPGYVRSPTGVDCDPDDATIHHDAVETWGDATDSDCDGEDSPSCIAVNVGRDVTALVASDTRCMQSADVRLAGVVDCWSCCSSSGKVLGFIGNSGGLPFRGRAEVRYVEREGGTTTEGEVLTVEELAPLASAFFEFDGDNGELEFQLLLYDEQGMEISNCSGEGLTKSFQHGRCPCAR